MPSAPMSRSGGSVVAAYETSLRDETGKPRADFGLADVFGRQLVSGPRGIVKNTYVALDGSIRSTPATRAPRASWAARA